MDGIKFQSSWFIFNTECVEEWFVDHSGLMELENLHNHGFYPDYLIQIIDGTLEEVDDYPLK